MEIVVIEFILLLLLFCLTLALSHLLTLKVNQKLEISSHVVRVTSVNEPFVMRKSCWFFKGNLYSVIYE